MTNDEARALLIQQGTLMIAARARISDAAEEWWDAARLLLIEAVARLPVAEQELCFRESCIRAGFEPDDPRFIAERRSFKRMAAESFEARMEEQRDFADLN